MAIWMGSLPAMYMSLATVRGALNEAIMHHMALQPAFTREPSIFVIHFWPPFWTVVCLGIIQITSTYYSSVLTVESLPSHVPLPRRRKHNRVFTSLFTLFIGLTFLLAKLNDSNQYRAELTIQREREKQAVLEAELKQTLDAVVDSQKKLAQIKKAVDAHPPGPERAAMLQSLSEVQSSLHARQTAMSTVAH